MRVTETISIAHPALPGHFPGRPIVPGVLLLERVCRVARRSHGRGIAAVAAVKFHAPLLPDEAFVIELDLPRGRRVGFRIARGATLIAAGLIELSAADE